MIQFRDWTLTIGKRVMNGTNDRDCGTVLQIGDDCNGPVLVRWENTGEETWQGADCLYNAA